MNPVASYELNLYFYPSPLGVDWRSPFHLTKSAVLNSFSLKKRMIGHVSVELVGEHPTRFVGMSTKHFKQNKKLLVADGLGLGILLHQYPGHLEKESDLAAERDDRFESGRFSFIKFQLSRDSYLKVYRYLTEYEEQNKFAQYGLPNRPRYGEGAGCSAFAISFLEIANVLDKEFQMEWSGKVKLPEKLIGTKNIKVSIFKLIFPNHQNLNWAKPNEPGIEISFWDPDKMHAWVQKKIQNKLTLEQNYKIAQIKNTHGLIVNMRDRNPTSESIWL